MLLDVWLLKEKNNQSLLQEKVVQEKLWGKISKIIKVQKQKSITNNSTKYIMRYFASVESDDSHMSDVEKQVLIF